MQVSASSLPFVLPHKEWSDDLSTINGNLEWDSLLDRSGVNLIVLDDERHHLLIHQLRRVGQARFERRPTIFLHDPSN